MPDTLITVDSASKKFCRSLKRSLWYGVKDLGRELIGGSNGARDLRKHEFWAIRDVCFELKRGETLGLIGPNGAGKTTLLRMLNGLIKPDQGRIQVKGRMQALIALGAGFNPILTGGENIYVNAAVLGMPKAEVDRRFDEIVEFSGIREFIDAPVQSYSSGMAVRLGFAVAAHLNPDILLIDEVLAVGDEGFQAKCLDKIGDLRANGTAVILVSHNMHTISTYADRVILVHKGTPRQFADVGEGISAYRRLFSQSTGLDIQKVTSGTNEIEFYEVTIDRTELSPGDDFSVQLKYSSQVTFRDIEIDICIYSSNQRGLYFQATNRTYNCLVNLDAGMHRLDVVIKDIRINEAVGRVTITIWSNRRGRQLFWWRIPVSFRGVKHSTGTNFCDIAFHHE